MESMKSAITNTIPEFAGIIAKHVGYPFQVDNNLRNLKKETSNLVAMKKDVKTAIESSERENSAPTNEVLEWLRKVEAIEKEAEEIQENSRKRHRSFWSDYTTSKSAAKKLCEVSSLCHQKASIEVTVHLPPSIAQEIPVSSSKPSNLESVLHYINKDIHNIIGIWGMGGVGKTHLLKQINNELCRDGAFNVVIFVTCSKECSAEKVQEEIITKLGLTRSDNAEIRQSTIHNFLKKRSFVLLLDDLWSRVDLQTIGIPTINEGTDNCKRKVVLTTRSENVCRLMEVDEKMRVDVLDWDAAWNLFKGKANEKNIESNTLVRKYVGEIVKKLSGLPLALITIGRAMSDTTDPREWKHAAELLKKARLHEVEHSETDETVFELLKFSYDKLRNDNLRECFLHCALWPEDYEIERDVLVELWMALGLIDEDDMHLAYNVGYSYIRELQAVCLLEATNRESYFKLHDVIRDMSLWIVSKQGIEKNKWIVISNVSAHGSKEIVIKEETEKIALINPQGEFVFSNTDCDGNITTLLTFYFFRGDVLKELNSRSFSKLTVLKLKSNGLDGVPIVICTIITLQFIDLSYNKIVSLPIELGALINLKYLLLRGTRILTVPDGIISKMRALKVLDLTPSHEWGIEGELAFVPSLLKEVQSLPTFRALGIEIDKAVHFHGPSALSHVPLRWLSVSIRERLFAFSFSPCCHVTSQSRCNLVLLTMTEMVLGKLIFECPRHYPSSCQLDLLEKLCISWVSVKEIQWKGLEPKTVFPMLKCITIDYCDELTSISWVVHLPCLEELNVNSCRRIKQLVIESDVKEPTFPSLKLLDMCGLDELESVCDQEIAFPALESLKIRVCDKLKKFPFRADHIPPKLSSITCDSEYWWNNIEWEDRNLKSLLYGFIKFA